jgi:RNA polymerase sigma factor (sigma-70 family)
VATRTSEVRDSGAEVARLYGEYGAQIQRFCLGRLRSREDAEDATQNTFLRAYAALRRGVVPELESAWLFKIARNVCLSRRLAGSRRSRVETPHDLQAMQDWIPAPGDDHDELIRLDEALATLPERLQRAILLREWQGLSYSEIALELGISLSAVETLIFRARRQLAQALENTVAKPARRLKQALSLGPLLGTLKGLLGATGAANLTAGAAAVAVLTVGGLEAGGIHALPSGGSNRRSTTPATTPAPVVASRAVHVRSSGTKSSVAARPRPAGSVGGAKGIRGHAARRRAPVTQGAATVASAGASGVLPGAPAGGGTDPGRAPGAPSVGTPSTAAQPQLQPAAQPKVSASTGTGTGPIVQSPGPPAVTVPPVTTPAVTTPVVTVPPVTTPAVTTPVVTVPPVTTPAVSVPAVTTPAVTTPAVTTPAVTTPAVTVPPVTVPSTPAPSVSVPVPSVPTPTATVAVPPPPTVAVPSVPTPPVSVPVPPPAPPPQPSVPAVTLPQVP